MTATFEEWIAAPADETRGQVLSALAGGNPFVMLTAVPTGDNGFTIRMETGGGIEDMDTIESLLRKAHAAVAAQMEEHQ